MKMTFNQMAKVPKILGNLLCNNLHSIDSVQMRPHRTQQKCSLRSLICICTTAEITMRLSGAEFDAQACLASNIAQPKLFRTHWKSTGSMLCFPVLRISPSTGPHRVLRNRYSRRWSNSSLSRALCIVLHLVSFRSLFYISWIINTRFLLNARADTNDASPSLHIRKRRMRAHNFQYYSVSHSHTFSSWSLLRIVYIPNERIVGQLKPNATGDAPHTHTHTHATRHIFELFRDNKWASGEKMPLVHSEHSRIIVRYSGFIAITQQLRLTISMFRIEFCVLREFHKCFHCNQQRNLVFELWALTKRINWRRKKKTIEAT